MNLRTNHQIHQPPSLFYIVLINQGKTTVKAANGAQGNDTRAEKSVFSFVKSIH